MKKDNPFLTERLSHGKSNGNSSRMNTFRKLFRFLFSRRGILTVCILIPLGGLLWFYSMLGPWRAFFMDLPGLSGIFGTKHYLLLLQNENELRPTGGFLTSFAVVEAGGLNPDIQFYNSEQVAVPKPPEKAPAPVERVLSRDSKYAGWVFRDTNFALDFSENAEKALEFLRRDERFQDIAFDGVIALDTTFLEDMVDLLGPFTLHGKPLTSENLFTTLQLTAKNFDHHDLEAWKGRKDAFAPLAQQMLKTLKTSPSRWRKFFRMAGENALQKHLLFFFSNDRLEQKFTARGWSGKLPSDPFWTVNFANLGGRKGDRFLRKDFHSSLHVQPNGILQEHFSMLLDHEGTHNLQSDRYEAFVRIVRPRGTTLLSTNGNFETAPRQASQPYGEETSFFVVLNPGEEKLLSFEFALPETVSFAQDFRLNIPLFKQPGTGTTNWNFTLRAENDPHFSAEGCTTATSHENVFFCDLQLIQDVTLKFEKHPDETPPLLQFARFTDIRSAEIRFSEDIFPEIRLQDVILTDLDRRSGGTDDIIVREVTVSGENVVLQFSGMTQNAGEMFRLEIHNLRDLSGNFFQTEGEEKGYFMTTLVQE